MNTFRMSSRSWEALWGTLIIGLFIMFCSLDAQVSQTSGNLEVQVGDHFTLKCSYSNLYRTYFWFHQVPGVRPSLILSIVSQESQTNKSFVANYLENGKESHLHCRTAQLQDSGNYFCAVWNTGTYKMFFGSGTRLVVKPNLEDSEPSVYQLKSSKEPNNIAACLVTDYSPNPIDVNISRTVGEPTNGSLVVVKDGNKESASLGVVLWGKNDDDFHCSATYKNISYEAEKSGADMCSETTPSGLLEEPVFETDERLNLLSLTVLGLRLIFFKSVALNLILTYHAWSR